MPNPISSYWDEYWYTHSAPWVVVDQTEGVVNKINLRSTQIQTWDEADVIVPNADMISRKVTNWTLEKPSGRLILNVDVAYGSDTALVRKLLLETATSHPAVIKDGSVLEPMVMFLGFGDNALNMELRCFIKNIRPKKRLSSVEQSNGVNGDRYGATSDINGT